MDTRTIRTVDIARWNPCKSGKLRRQLIRRTRRMLATQTRFPEWVMLTLDDNGGIQAFHFLGKGYAFTEVK